MKLTLVPYQLWWRHCQFTSSKRLQWLSLKLTKLNTVFSPNKISHRHKGTPGREDLVSMIAFFLLHRYLQMESILLGTLDMSYQIALVRQKKLGKRVVTWTPVETKRQIPNSLWIRWWSLEPSLYSHKYLISISCMLKQELTSALSLLSSRWSKRQHPYIKG